MRLFRGQRGGILENNQIDWNVSSGVRREHKHEAKQHVSSFLSTCLLDNQRRVPHGVYETGFGFLFSDSCQREEKNDRRKTHRLCRGSKLTVLQIAIAL